LEEWKSNSRVFATLATPGTFWLLFFFLIPLGFLLVLSFSSKAVIDGQVSITEYSYLTGLDNYARALNPDIISIFLRTLLWSGLATLACLLVGYPIAFGICFMPEKWRPLALLLIVLPFWINLLIRTYALKTVMGAKGVINSALTYIYDPYVIDMASASENSIVKLILNGLFGGLWLISEVLSLLLHACVVLVNSIIFILNVFISLVNSLPGIVYQQTPFSPVGSPPYEMLGTTPAVIFGLVYVFLPFMILPLYSTIERLDKSFLEASLDLGATQFQTFRKITLPLTMPGVVTGIILVFIPCLGMFLISDELGGTRSWMIGNVIQAQFGSSNDWPFGAALSFILMFLTFIVLFGQWAYQSRSKGVRG
jgi:spermidine/putrescine transport system permease protein